MAESEDEQLLDFRAYVIASVNGSIVFGAGFSIALALTGSINLGPSFVIAIVIAAVVGLIVAVPIFLPATLVVLTMMRRRALATRSSYAVAGIVASYLTSAVILLPWGVTLTIDTIGTRDQDMAMFAVGSVAVLLGLSGAVAGLTYRAVKLERESGSPFVT